MTILINIKDATYSAFEAYKDYPILFPPSFEPKVLEIPAFEFSFKQIPIHFIILELKNEFGIQKDVSLEFKSLKLLLPQEVEICKKITFEDLYSLQDREILEVDFIVGKYDTLTTLEQLARERDLADLFDGDDEFEADEVLADNAELNISPEDQYAGFNEGDVAQIVDLDSTGAVDGDLMIETDVDLVEYPNEVNQHVDGNILDDLRAVSQDDKDTEGTAWIHADNIGEAIEEDRDTEGTTWIHADDIGVAVEEEELVGFTVTKNGNFAATERFYLKDGNSGKHDAEETVTGTLCVIT